MEILFKTIHGSHLYGLANENSDQDFYTVVSKVKTNRAKYARQSIVDDIDSTVVDFGTWIGQCQRGVPQALEAMFSQKPIIDNISAFRAGFRGGTQCWDRYLRTIKSFALDEDNSFKKKRHALRLALNLNQLAKYGRFNPTLDEALAQTISIGATLTPDKVYDMAKYYVWMTGCNCVMCK